MTGPELPPDRAFDLLRELRGPGHEPHLESILKARTAGGGRITFAEFMALALYHPEYGYYRNERPKFGPSGDFLTAPEVHPLFGRLIGRQVLSWWQAAGQPSPFTVVEMGGGSGAFARDLLAAVRTEAPDLAQVLDYLIIETSAALVDQQRAAISAVDRPNVRWREVLSERGLVGCVLANEFVDALPVHRVTVRDARLQELYVAQAAGGFVEALGDLSTPAIAAYFERVGAQPAEGAGVEVNLAAVDWLATVRECLSDGFILIVDYGSLADDLYHRRSGTLRTFYRHTVGGTPFKRIGRQDLTAHVDFSGVIATATELGLPVVEFTTQRELLRRLGAGTYLEQLGCRGISRADEQRERSAVEYLLAPGGMGDFRVLMLRRQPG